MDGLPPPGGARASRSVWGPFQVAFRANLPPGHLLSEFAYHAARELAGVSVDTSPGGGGDGGDGSNNGVVIDETATETLVTPDATSAEASGVAALPASEAKRRRTTADAAGPGSAALSSSTTHSPPLPPPAAAADSPAAHAWVRAAAAAAAAGAAAAATPPPAGEDCVSALCAAADASRRMRASTQQPPPPPPTQPAAASFSLSAELRRDVTVATRQDGLCRAVPPVPPRDAVWGRLFEALYSNKLQLGVAVVLQGDAGAPSSPPPSTHPPPPPSAFSHSRRRVLNLACRCCCGPDCGDGSDDGAAGAVSVPLACHATLSAACFAAWRAAGGTRPGWRQRRCEEGGGGGGGAEEREEELLHVSAEFSTPTAVRRRRLVLARCPEASEPRVVCGFEESAEAVPWHGRQLSGGVKVEGGIGLVEVAVSSSGGKPLRTLGRGRFRVGRSAGFDAGSCGGGGGSDGVVRVQHSSRHHACGDVDLKRLTATVGGVGLDALCLDGTFDDACDEAIAILLGSYLVFNDGELPGEDAV